MLREELLGTKLGPVEHVEDVPQLRIYRLPHLAPFPLFPNKTTLNRSPATLPQVRHEVYKGPC